MGASVPVAGKGTKATQPEATRSQKTNQKQTNQMNTKTLILATCAVLLTGCASTLRKIDTALAAPGVQRALNTLPWNAGYSYHCSSDDAWQIHEDLDNAAWQAHQDALDIQDQLEDMQFEQQLESN
jgi:hypothetical protein